MAIPTLLPEQFQYTETGVLLNADVAVPFADITKISGLDSADIRQSVHDREGMDGGYVDALYEQQRTVIIEGTLYTDNRSMETFLDQLKANFAPSALPQPLFIGTDAQLRVVYGKSLGIKYDKESLRRIGSCDYQIQIVCEDPRIYSPNIVSTQIVLGSTVISGRGYNKSFNYGYGTPSTGNQATLILSGNRSQPGIIRIYGPITNPSIICGNTTMTFNLTIDNGDYIEINLNNRTVKLNGTAGRRNKMTLSGNWFLLQPGPNTIALSGASTLSGTTKLTVSANEAAWR